jgi:hypothetical protein
MYVEIRCFWDFGFLEVNLFKMFLGGKWYKIVGNAFGMVHMLHHYVYYMLSKRIKAFGLVKQFTN